MDRKMLLGIAKDWGLALLVVIAVFGVWSLVRPHPPSSGPAPDFVLHDVQGGEVSLASLKGDVAVINFWATWCGPCRAEIPELAAFHAAHPDVPMYGISVDENLSGSKLNAFGRKIGINYPILLDDGHASESYGVDTIPATFVLDANGHIGRVIVGGTTQQTLEAAIETVRNG